MVCTWGSGDSGCLGTGHYESSEVPVPVFLPQDLAGCDEVVAEAGGYHNCVILRTKSNTKVKVWGRGDVG